MIAYVMSQFKLRYIRATAVVAGIAIGAMLYITLTTLGEGFHKAASLPLQGVSADMIATKPFTGEEEGDTKIQGAKGIRQPFGMTFFTEEELDQLRSTEGIEDYSETLQLWDFAENNYRTILGISPGEGSVGPGVALRKHILEGRSFDNEETHVVVLDKHFAAFYKYTLDSEIIIGGTPFRVIGIVEMPDSNQTATSNMYVPLNDAQTIVKTDQVNQVYIKVSNANDVENVTQQLSQRITNISLMSEDSLVQVMGGIGKISTRFARVAGVVGLLGGFFLGWFTLSGLIAERSKEIGLMRALGWNRRDVLKAFLLETAILGVLGGIIGVLFGMAASWGLGQIPLPDLNQTVSSHVHGLEAAVPEDKELKLPIEISLTNILVSLLSALLSVVMACWISVKRDLFLKPTKLLKN